MFSSLTRRLRRWLATPEERLVYVNQQLETARAYLARDNAIAKAGRTAELYDVAADSESTVEYWEKEKSKLQHKIGRLASA